MKKLYAAAAAAALLIGTSAAMAAGDSPSGSGSSVETSPAVQSETNSAATPNAPGKTHAGTHAAVKVRHVRSTTGSGIGSENNANAPDSRLPDKDKLNSKAFLQDH